MGTTPLTLQLVGAVIMVSVGMILHILNPPAKDAKDVKDKVAKKTE